MMWLGFAIAGGIDFINGMHVFSGLPGDSSSPCKGISH
jgi:hypothetical protein